MTPESPPSTPPPLTLISYGVKLLIFLQLESNSVLFLIDTLSRVGSRVLKSSHSSVKKLLQNVEKEKFNILKNITENLLSSLLLFFLARNVFACSFSGSSFLFWFHLGAAVHKCHY